MLELLIGQGWPKGENVKQLRERLTVGGPPAESSGSLAGLNLANGRTTEGIK